MTHAFVRALTLRSSPHSWLWRALDLRRTASLVAMLTFWSAPSFAQNNDAGSTPNSSSLGSTATLEQLMPPKDASAPPPQADKGDAKVPAAWQVSPAAEPQPALRYRLWPSPIDLDSHDAEPHFYRAILMLRDLTPADREAFGSLSTIPLNELPSPTNWNGERYAGILREIKLVASSESFRCSHFLRQATGIEVLTMTLPELNDSRSLVELLLIEARMRLRERQFDEAVQSLQLAFRMSAYIAQGETLIHNLVGIATASRTLDVVEEVMRTPGSPNLYWALATLPRPLVDMTNAVQMEGDLPYLLFPRLRDIEKQSLSPAEWTRITDDIIERLTQMTPVIKGETNSGDFMLLQRLQLALGTTGARDRLLQQGLPAEQIDAMSLPQQIALDTAFELRRLRDDFHKFMLLPEPHRSAMASHSQLVTDKLGRAESRNALASQIGKTLFAAIHSAQRREIQLDARVHRAMTIEALRMHLAAHEGRWPESLRELTPVPAIHNPLTLSDFDYRIDRAATPVKVYLKIAEFADDSRLGSLEMQIRP